MRQVLLVEVGATSSLNDLVVNVSDIHHVQDVVLEILGEDATENIEGDVGPRGGTQRSEYTYTCIIRGDGAVVVGIAQRK